MGQHVPCATLVASASPPLPGALRPAHRRARGLGAAVRHDEVGPRLRGPLRRPPASSPGQESEQMATHAQIEVSPVMALNH